MSKALYPTEDNQDMEPFDPAKFPENITRFFNEVVTPRVDAHLGIESSKVAILTITLPDCIDCGIWEDHPHLTNSAEFNALARRPGIERVSLGGNMNKGWPHMEIEFK